MADSGETAPQSAAQGPWTVRKVLEWTTAHLKKHGSDTPRLDAEILLAAARGCQRIQLYTDFDSELTEAVRAKMRDLVQRRAKAEPVAYLVGHREFFSLKFRVNSSVLIPRPDTETLVACALDRLQPVTIPDVPPPTPEPDPGSPPSTQGDSNGSPADGSGHAVAEPPAPIVRKSGPARRTRSAQLPPAIVADIGTGSGCIGISILKHAPHVRLLAVDVSADALSVAEANARDHAVQDRVSFHQGDLFSALPAGTVCDLIVSNPPYIPSAEIAGLDADVRDHEPRMALDGGESGFVILERLLQEAPAYLQPGGWLLVEFSPEQSEGLVPRANATGHWDQVQVHKDLAQRARVLAVRKRT